MVRPKIKGTLLWDYFLESIGAKLVEKYYGFAIYTIKDEECFIEHIYVAPEYRKGTRAASIADEITDSVRGQCTILKGCVDQDSPTKDTSIAVLEGYGMRFWYESPEYLYFKKDI